MADQETGQTTGEADPVSQPDSAADERRPARESVSTDNTNTHTQDNEAASTQKEDAQIDGVPGSDKMVKEREEKVSQSTDTLPAVKVEEREAEVSSTNDKQGESTAAAHAPALSSSGHKLLRPSAFSPGSTATGMSGRMVSNPFTRKPAVLCGPGTEGSLLAPSKLAPNPFAAKAPHIHSVSSDSEDEKKDRPIVGPSHFHPGGAAVIGGGAIACEALTAGSPGRSILRPSALDKQTANFNKAKFDIVPSKTSFVLKPATLQSPLTNSTSNEQDSKENEAKTDAGVESSQVSNSRDTRQPGAVSANQMFCSGSEATKENYFACEETESESKEFIFGQGMDKRVSNEAGCVSSTSCDASAAAAAPAEGGFVFGQNLADRVTGGAAGGDDVSPVPGRPKTPPAIPAPPDVELSPHASLEESAAAYKARQARPEYQEVQVTTGEEDESNVFQILGKLFVFDKAQHSWSEKGRGLLRLNDMHGPEGRKPFQSRLVMRTQGSLRVILNTKVWSGMTVERASTKGVRITAMDGETLRVYLIMANPKDADQIFSAIDWRVQQLKVTEQENSQRLSTGEAEAAAARESCQSNGKRQHQPESPDSTDTIKKPRLETEQRRVLSEETSNDSSTVDPETEASSESLTSSPVVKSSPSTTSE